MANAFRLSRNYDDKKPTRYYSSSQEKQVAKAIGGKQTANSGATAYSKGDVTSDNWLIECKTKVTDSKTITVHEEWFNKNIQESAFMGKQYSAVVINFGPNKPNYYCVDEPTFQEFLEFQTKYGINGFL